MTLEEYINKEIKELDTSTQEVINLFSYDEYPKGHLLLKEGDLSNNLIYVEQGLLRLYYLKDEKDITQYFFAENMFYLPIENVFLKVPYPYRLELLENSTLRIISFSTFEEHSFHSIPLQKFVRHLTSKAIKGLAERLRSIQFQSAQERYNILLDRYPQILLRAPLGHIASYLGITQQTLSVIRAEKSK